MTGETNKSKRIILNTILILAAIILVIIIALAIKGLGTEKKKENDRENDGEYARKIAVACHAALANEDAYAAAMDIIDSPAGQLVLYLDASGLTGAPNEVETELSNNFERDNKFHVPEYRLNGAEVFIIKIRDNSMTVWSGKKDGTTLELLYQ